MRGEGARKLLAAVEEKDGPSNRFCSDGEPLGLLPGPGGVMSHYTGPWQEDQFLATRKFFSPNFGGDTRQLHPIPSRRYLVERFCDLLCSPFWHLEAADGQLWVLACSIRGGAETGVKDDWRTPGACLGHSFER